LDLSFARRNVASFAGPFASSFVNVVTALPTELAVLLVGVAARQAASPTARIQARLMIAGVSTSPLAPAGGAFSALAAAALRDWQRA
jgi:hypothetical protein